MKQRLSAVFGSFTRMERVLLFGSLLLVVIPFFIFDKTGYLRLAASLIGVLALILCAKGLPIGQIFMITFCVLYTVISYSFAYYGEMITYFGMSLPMAIFSLVTWLKNPFEKGHAEVKVGRIGRRERWLLVFLAITVTVLFYFILGYFNTANLLVSTLSVTTSFVAAYLTMRRSPYYALAYTLNDVVLIVLWILASITDISYLSVTFCFVAFIANDLYGFFHWLSMRKRQVAKNPTAKEQPT
ncbi:MAG: nicotinamide mononucleotide transporter [Clostridia bacterium]|nr:nicotinamide mononucleotide transporter [Clostridia bacterium]